MAGNDYKAVLFYVPNLIGYSRVLLTAAAYYYFESDWQICLVAYSLSFILDLFDGIAARHFKQCSQFGAVLDMVTDRCSTCGFLMLLTHIYPAHKLALHKLATTE